MAKQKTDELSRQGQQRYDTLTATFRRIDWVTSRIDPERLRSLAARALMPITPDGYPSASMSDHGSGGSVSTPTEGAVIAREREQRDELRDALKAIERRSRDASELLEGILATLDYMLAVEEEKKERATSTRCGGDENPILGCVLPATKGGLCVQHYGEWLIDGRPDLPLWKLWKTKATNADGELLVSEKPFSSPEYGLQDGRNRWRHMVKRD